MLQQISSLIGIREWSKENADLDRSLFIEHDQVKWIPQVVISYRSSDMTRDLATNSTRLMKPRIKPQRLPALFRAGNLLAVRIRSLIGGEADTMPAMYPPSNILGDRLVRKQVYT